MHKFTIFTIVLSAMVVLVVADLVLNDYWGKDFDPPPAADETEVAADTEALAPTLLAEEAAGRNPELRGDEGGAVIELPAEGVSTEPTVDATVGAEEIPAEPSSEAFVPGRITAELIATSGLLEPRLESAPLAGLLYGFWDVSDALADFSIVEHQIFDGPNFTATVYEIQGDNEIRAFAAYEALRQTALSSPLGDINENNSYGDGSFYFNHSTKLNTVYLVVRKGLSVYAFQYAHPAHATFVRPLIDRL